MDQTFGGAQTFSLSANAGAMHACVCTHVYAHIKTHTVMHGWALCSGWVIVEGHIKGGEHIHKTSDTTLLNASKRGSPEMVSTYSKDKHDKNGEGREAHERSRREKREHKRKREHEDSSKKKHKEKHKGKTRHHKTKEKRKDRVSRRKDSRALDYMSSESKSSTSFVSSRGAYHNHHSRSHTLNTDLPWECSHSGIADVPNAYRLKRFKGHNEDDFRQIREASKDSMQVENDVLRHCSNEHLVQVKDTTEGTKSKRCYSDIQQDGGDVSMQRNQEQKRPNGRKDKVLEVELRQKALANFLRHQDVSCKMDEHQERISPTTSLGATQPTFKNEQSERAVMDVDSSRRTTLLPGDARSVDAPVDACANNTSTHVSQNFVREGSKLACNLRSNLEEGEIGSDNEYETGHDDACCVAADEKDRVPHDEEETLKNGEEARKGFFREHHKVRPTSAAKEGEVERLSTGVDAAATCIDEKGELLQGKAVEGSGNVDVAAGAGRDGSDSSFQQKTMSVMRGGEMVQVNYKVYIPKRAAELARKRLQR